MARAVMRALIEQHADDAAFLWLQRDDACRAPHYSLADLAKLDGRLEAQLAALRLDSELSWRFCKTALELNEPGEVFTAGVVACGHSGQDRLAEVANVAVTQVPLSRGLCSALGWVSAAVATQRTRPWQTAESPKLRRIAIAVAAIHRLDPGPVLRQLLDDADHAVKARALRAVGELAASAYLSAARKSMNHPDPSCRFWACWSAARLGDKSAAAELQLIAQAESPHRARAVDMAVRIMPPNSAQRWLQVLCELPGGTRPALQGFGRLGDPAAIPRLLDAMKTPALARLAGEAFTFITGVDLELKQMAATMPEGFKAGPTEDAADENVDIDPDENLPWPDLEKISQWWQRNRAALPQAQRLLLGKPITSDWCREALRIGRQRHRAAAALELALREPNSPLYNVCAPSHSA